MDESHRYRASAGVRAINELKPIIGLELTATPYVETSRGAVPFRNVIYSYSLSQAMADGFVKEPAVVTQKNFNPTQFKPEQLEEIKLQEGVRLHESVKVELETYARQSGQVIVKPFLLVIARDTTHASQLMQLIQSDKFFEGHYKDKVIQVASSRTGAEEEEMIQRLLAVESTEEPTEIVIHVNMLKEGWDVTNLYTIVPLRAANARMLIEQSIGRGLRLPYGKRTGVTAVDRLNIVAHDRFQEIIEEANKPDSVIHRSLTQVVLEPGRDFQKTATVIAQPAVEQAIGINVSGVTTVQQGAPIFESAAEQKIAQATFKVIQELERLPTSAHLSHSDVTEIIINRVEEEIAPAQLELEGIAERPVIAAVVGKTTELLAQKTIDIPRILIVPKGEVTLGFHAFQLDTKSVNFQPVDRDLLIQHLRTNQQEFLTAHGDIKHEKRLEDYLVRALIDFDDISYDDHADLLYELAGQIVQHLTGYLKDEDKVRNVLLYHQQELARLIHAQMQAHQWESAVEYEVVVSKGFTALKQSAYTALSGPPQPFRQPVQDKSRMGKVVFGGFARCLYPVQKFDSDTERKFAVVLETDSTVRKWFKPARGQFQIFYKDNNEHREYQPDFVAETTDCIYMCETKARGDIGSTEVSAKKEAALKWCGHATDHAKSYNGKPWKYILVPHDIIAENMTLKGLEQQCLRHGDDI
jgi:type III restriction enzyme